MSKRLMLAVITALAAASMPQINTEYRPIEAAPKPNTKPYTNMPMINNTYTRVQNRKQRRGKK
jgi:hypothetical protein